MTEGQRDTKKHDFHTLSEKLRVLVEVAIKVAFPILLGMAGWTFSNLNDHEKRLIRIESTRYTRGEADLNIKAIRDQITALREAFAEERAGNKAVDDRMDRIETRIEKILDLLQRSKK